MVRSYSLEPRDLQQHQALEEEKRNLLAQFGALTLDLENIRTRLTGLDTRSRTFLSDLAQQKGISDYRWLRVENQQLVGDVFDPPQPANINGKGD
jgi:hypothetical protein